MENMSLIKKKPALLYVRDQGFVGFLQSQWLNMSSLIFPQNTSRCYFQSLASAWNKSSHIIHSLILSSEFHAPKTRTHAHVELYWYYWEVLRKQEGWGTVVVSSVLLRTDIYSSTQALEMNRR